MAENNEVKHGEFCTFKDEICLDYTWNLMGLYNLLLLLRDTLNSYRDNPLENT